MFQISLARYLDYERNYMHIIRSFNGKSTIKINANDVHSFLRSLIGDEPYTSWSVKKEKYKLQNELHSDLKDKQTTTLKI